MAVQRNDKLIPGRKVIPMKADGNCFYRALSYQLFGTQEEYDIVHSVVYRTEMYNKLIFANYLIPGHDETTIDDHLKKISVLGSWATQVEVVAAASAFEIPVYFYSKKPGSEDFVWNVVRPFNSTKKTLKLPVFPDISETISLQMPTHFELFYYDSLHYNAIVSEDTGKVCTHLPKLPDNYSELIQL